MLGERLKRLRMLLVAGALCACSHDSATYTIASASPWNEAYGLMSRQGTELAVDAINKRGGVRSHLLTLVRVDDEGTGTKAAAVAQDLVDTDSVLAVVGHSNSSATVAAARVYDGRLAAVSPSASSPEITGLSAWLFRVIPSDSANGQDLARFASSLGHKRAAILYENNSYGRGLADAFRRTYAGRVVSMDPIAESKDQPFDAYLEWFKRSRVDIVFVAGSEDSGLAFLRDARAHGLAADLIGGDGWSGLSNDTVRAQGVYVGVPFTAEDPRPRAQRFVAAFTERFHMRPDNNAALAYDATMVLYAAATRTSGDRRAIRDYLASLTSATAYPGVTGPISFRPDGDPVGKNVVMTRIDHGILRVAQAGE